MLKVLKVLNEHLAYFRPTGFPEAQFSLVQE
jgi:hypothetical protein